MFWQTSRHQIDLSRPRVMGIVNVTPDSFFDGGRHLATDAARAHCDRLVQEGADILDIGGESTRPGAQAPGVQEEIDRVLPVLEHACTLGVPVSVDTSSPALMRAALDAQCRHRQRRARAAAARCAGDGGRTPVVRRVPDAHARRRPRDDAAGACAMTMS